ncbi:MAG: hypothetical protein A2445_00910 [Candidatus Jacksonbacteria bacterium RIFOXYC2_FULL_44_29]|nr:MAG: hypothetical protein UW45_C0024G0019 [Parcubacteria group bacterium GW2011_GWC2_44_22]OGY75060.1 MAG: hypothetical protein A2240_00630 [Candidatus Jacksonbacteria bacterium RIFOXYA2_FULL_43_12]OGY76640.1 MAG: hypothetical protein A2295_00920 [Candidatus Jacksonbacteria bacterium RIFOXYB2_FULL_44_15]OGY79487.1 MAG: hypothetical protein A2445_00910 [Candidatus Jacksonbacteria bacterium RIFOXYC2_FULL_44_29]OGY79975.1 MAG: hypothetical protein A2550_05555 [Candidatus Jacksonbacteria bacteri
MPTSQEICRQIKKKFVDGFKNLDDVHQSHFAVRMYRLTGESKYISPVYLKFSAKLQKLLPSISNLNDEGGLALLADDLISTSLPAKDNRHKMRQEFYRKHPLFLYQIRLLKTAFEWKSFSVDQIFSSEYNQVLKYLSSVNFEAGLLAPDYLKIDATSAVNSVYYLHYLKVLDLRRRLQEQFSQVKKFSYRNRIYGLTHFIIGASYYYQQFVDVSAYRWILEIFEAEIEEIKRRTTPDIIAEIGVCYKLCQVENSGLEEKLQDYLNDSFNFEHGFIPRRGVPDTADKLNLAEHRNIVAYIFLINFKKLYPGPDLRPWFMGQPKT